MTEQEGHKSVKNQMIFGKMLDNWLGNMSY